MEMVDKKQIWAIILFELKMGHKAAETDCNTNAVGPGTANKCIVVVQEVLQRRREPWRWA